MAMNREQKRMLRRQGQDPDGQPTRRQPPAQPSRGSERTTARQFLSEVRQEMRKVVWPGWPEVLNSSIVVLVTLTLVTIMIAILDWVFGQFSLALFET